MGASLLKVVVDTNILVRAVRLDDEDQSALAARTLREATVLVVPLIVLCEFAWVMGSTYRRSRPEIHAMLTALIAARNVVVDREAAASGLAFLGAGGDFADGVVAFDGHRLGGEAFASFDRRARRLAVDAGYILHPEYAG